MDIVHSIQSSFDMDLCRCFLRKFSLDPFLNPDNFLRVGIGAMFDCNVVEATKGDEAMFRSGTRKK